MLKKRKKYNSRDKFRIALEAVRGEKTLSELSSKTGVQTTQISKWKRQLLDKGSSIFERNMGKQEVETEKEENELYEQIGRLKMELEWVKKKATAFS